MTATRARSHPRGVRPARRQPIDRARCRAGAGRPDETFTRRRDCRRGASHRGRSPVGSIHAGRSVHIEAGPGLRRGLHLTCPCRLRRSDLAWLRAAEVERTLHATKQGRPYETRRDLDGHTTSLDAFDEGRLSEEAHAMMATRPLQISTTVPRSSRRKLPSRRPARGPRDFRSSE